MNDKAPVNFDLFVSLGLLLKKPFCPGCHQRITAYCDVGKVVLYENMSTYLVCDRCENSYRHSNLDSHNRYLEYSYEKYQFLGISDLDCETWGVILASLFDSKKTTEVKRHVYV